jgi:hypothetical protein
VDAFASVELLRYPQAQGLLVVIGGRAAHRSISADGPACERALRSGG